MPRELALEILLRIRNSPEAGDGHGELAIAKRTDGHRRDRAKPLDYSEISFHHTNSFARRQQIYGRSAHVARSCTVEPTRAIHTLLV